MLLRWPSRFPSRAATAPRRIWLPYDHLIVDPGHLREWQRWFQLAFAGERAGFASGKYKFESGKWRVCAGETGDVDCEGCLNGTLPSTGYDLDLTGSLTGGSGDSCESAHSGCSNFVTGSATYTCNDGPTESSFLGVVTCAWVPNPAPPEDCVPTTVTASVSYTLSTGAVVANAVFRLGLDAVAYHTTLSASGRVDCSAVSVSSMTWDGFGTGAGSCSGWNTLQVDMSAV